MRPDLQRLRADYANSDARWWLVPVLLVLLTLAAAVSLPTLERQSAERRSPASAMPEPLLAAQPGVDDEAPPGAAAAASSQPSINPSPLEGDESALEASRHAQDY